ncbi:RNA_polymerase II subunit Rpb11 [Hexamita inflata]|uniref:RNA polymerase II subunit Rpb11 n=1 Tax=Hexamita inflata TaxID=28002 RepID=A0AA86TT59_9EUKA|nr:RNA polymerase II subunit Rpb11 [Hexamita inflata]
MENVPDRLLQVHNLNIDKTLQPKVEVSKLIEANDAHEFTLPHIDHTLGYILKYELEQMEDVQYACLKLPHPLEQKLVMRVYSNKAGVQVKELFQRAVTQALAHLKQLNEIIQAANIE